MAAVSGNLTALARAAQPGIERLGCRTGKRSGMYGRELRRTLPDERWFCVYSALCFASGRRRPAVTALTTKIATTLANNATNPTLMS